MRVRESNDLAFQSVWTVNDKNTPSRGSHGTLNITNHSLISDFLHPGYKTLGSGDNGGGMALQSTVYTEVVPCSASYANYWWEGMEYFGPVIPEQYTNISVPPWSGQVPLMQRSDLQILGMGATAIARTTPTNPSFGFSRAIGEVRNDGLPAIVGLNALKNHARALKSSRSFAKTSGNEFLNYEFGWAPLIADLTNLAKAVKGSNKIIAQYRKGSDEKIKRRYNFPSESTTATYSGTCFVVPHEIMGNRLWNGVQQVTSQREASFSGAFRYHIPIGDDVSTKMARWEQESNKILGLRLTPKVVWDLAPWTWAYDWFSNAGDVVRNFSNMGSDSLLLQYGYIMSGVKQTWDMTASIQYNQNTPVYSCRTKVIRKDITRRAAKWWGFNFDISSLTASQDAIAVALGLSHGLR